MAIEDELRERLRKVEALFVWRDDCGRARGCQRCGRTAEGEARRSEPPRSTGRDEVHHAGPMVGAVVHRPLSPLWVQAFPICSCSAARF